MYEGVSNDRTWKDEARVESGKGLLSTYVIAETGVEKISNSDSELYLQVK